MQNAQLEVLKGCFHSLEKGQTVTLVSVAKTWGTSPRPLGSVLAVTSSGAFFGSVSGGCIEEDLIEQLQNNPVNKPQLIMYGETEEQRHHFGLPCGGVLQLIVEPFNNKVEIESLIKNIESRKTIYRSIELNSHTIHSQPWQKHHCIELDGNTWHNVFGPTWRLLIIGAGETGQYLANMAQSLGYDVLVSDPRPEYRKNWPLSHDILLEGFPDDVIDDLNIDERTAIVAVAHDPKVDDMALLSALNSDAFYVGALGSRQNNFQRRQRLQQHFGFTQHQVNQLHGPVGLHIGSKTPAEIALSILAEVTAIKNGVFNKDQSVHYESSPACLI